MYFRSNDPIADYDRYCDAEQESFEMHPRCEHCGEIIEDVLYEIGDSYYCEDCIIGAKMRVCDLVAI